MNSKKEPFDQLDCTRLGHRQRAWGLALGQWRWGQRGGVAPVWRLLALLAALTGCASAPPPSSVWAPLPERAPATAPADARSQAGESAALAGGRLSPEQAVDVTLYALGLVGTPYRWGGNTPDSGFDCSGLIAHVYLNRAQLKLPRTTAELAFVGQSVDPGQLRTGDLVLFGPGPLPNHAGIYVGQGRFVHAPSTGGTVRQDRLEARHWQTQRPRYRRP